jgi:hypothetical protein
MAIYALFRIGSKKSGLRLALNIFCLMLTRLPALMVRSRPNAIFLNIVRFFGELSLRVHPAGLVCLSHFCKHSSNCADSTRSNIRRKVSSSGMPLGSSKKLLEPLFPCLALFFHKK